MGSYHRSSEMQCCGGQADGAPGSGQPRGVTWGSSSYLRASLFCLQGDRAGPVGRFISNILEMDDSRRTLEMNPINVTKNNVSFPLSRRSRSDVCRVGRKCVWFPLPYALGGGVFLLKCEKLQTHRTLCSLS